MDLRLTLKIVVLFPVAAAAAACIVIGPAIVYGVVITLVGDGGRGFAEDVALVAVLPVAAGTIWVLRRVTLRLSRRVDHALSATGDWLAGEPDEAEPSPGDGRPYRTRTSSRKARDRGARSRE